jgi:hypothetical protein
MCGTSELSTHLLVHHLLLGELMPNGELRKAEILFCPNLVDAT